MAGFFTQWVLHTWDIIAEAAPWLLGGFALAGVIHVFVPVDRVVRHLGKPGFGPVLKAALFGIPLPLCSCSVIPVASSIRKQGASRGAFVSFLISTPETGVDSISLSYALLGPLLAIVRPLAAFVTAVTAGLLVGDGKTNPVAETSTDCCCCGSSPPPPPPEPAAGCCAAPVAAAAPASCCGSSHTSEAVTNRQPGKLATAVHYGLVEMMSDLSPYLLSGFIIAGLFSALIPEGFLETYLGSGILSMLLMLVVGLPLYVCATSSTPVAAALIAKGLSPGAALVFLLAGPATNVATMLIVVKDVGKRGLAIYLSTIAVVAVLFGLAIDATIDFLPASLAWMPDCLCAHAQAGGILAGVALVLLILNGLRVRYSRKSESCGCHD